MADLDDTAESGQSLLIDLFVGQKFRVIEKIPQEPAQLPHRLLGAVEPADNGLPRQCPGLNHREPENVKRLAGMPAELATIDAHKIDTVGDLRMRIVGRFGETWDFAVHAAPSRFGCV